MAADGSRLITTVLIEPNEVIREGLAALLDRDPRFDLLWRGPPAECSYIEQWQPEVVIVDPSRDGKFDPDLLAELRRIVSGSCIAIYSRVGSASALSSALSLDPSVYLLKGREGRAAFFLDTLALMARSKEQGLMLDKRIAPELAVRAAQALAVPAAGAALGALSEREREVLALVAEGFTNKTIADHLSITDSTVEDHVRRLRQKLEARSRSHLAHIAGTLGL